MRIHIYQVKMKKLTTKSGRPPPMPSFSRFVFALVFRFSCLTIASARRRAAHNSSGRRPDIVAVMSIGPC